MAAMQNSRPRNRTKQPTIPGRGGYQNYRREIPESEPSNSSPIRGVYKDHRTAVMMCSFMGTRTSVKTKNGSTYKGHTIGFSHTGDIALTDAKLEDDDNNQNHILPGLIIPKDTFVVCKTNGVDLKGLCSSSTDFIDSGIVSRMNGTSETSMRELEPWNDDDVPVVNPTLSLDDKNGGWDSHSMFQANRDKFNVKSTYSEDLHEYTTKLPDPDSEGYEERQKFAQRHADEIEQSEGYQNRIAKELGDGDEESQFSAVHRSGDPNVSHRQQESNSGSGKNVYTIPALRSDSEQGMRNGTLKGQGRGARQNSPYSPSPSHTQLPQHQHHPNVQQNMRQMNNHYQGPPPSGGPLNRNQGPPPLHSRQHGPQNHALPSYPHHHSHQQPPPPHAGMHQHQPPVSQHQPPVSQQHQHQPPVTQHQPPVTQQHQHQPPVAQHHQPPVTQQQHQHQPPVTQQHQHQPPVTQQHQHQPPVTQQHQHQPPVTQQHQHQPPVTQHQQHQPPVTQQHQHQPPVAQHQHQPSITQQHQHQSAITQQQQHQRPSPQQLVSPSGQHPIKSHPPHPHPQNVPPTLSSPSLSQQPPPLAQHHAPPQRVSPPQHQVPVQQPPNMNGPSGSSQSNHQYRQISTEGKNSHEVNGQKMPPLEVGQQVYHQKPGAGHQAIPNSLGVQNPSGSSSSGSIVEAQQIGQPSSALATSPPSVLVPDRRGGQEERNKIGQSLHDFKRNFVLESHAANSQESTRPIDTADGTPGSSTPTSSSVASTPVSSAPELVAQLSEQAADFSLQGAEKPEDDLHLAPKSKLNPNAKEFKPKSQPAPMEAQSPSPQPRSSPHMPLMAHYPPQQTVLMSYPYIQLNPQRKRATVSLGAGVVSDLTAHQVTGQPLLATQPPGMMYIQTPTQPLPAGYQFYSPQLINPRMVGPGSLTMTQSGQVTGLDQSAAQNQPQPVFMTTQQSVQAPIPAHLHHQPAHAQVMPHPSSNQHVQPAHVPNPAPSPVQQHNPQSIPQQLAHHMSQGPTQSATPQPAHYPQMTLNYTHGIPTMPRTSISGQQNMAPGHSSMSFISGPQFAYNGNTAQYAFAPAPQTPQTSHGSGPQYVVMPQPNPQGHPSMQQHTAQPYTAAGIPFQSQHLMQGPAQVPPSHNPNANQGSQHLIHPGMPAGLHQQVSGAQPGMYMQVPSTLQYHQQ